MPDYRLKYDFHTHTVFSHGKGTIEQNVMRAREIGLAAIAISDHGPGHMTYGIKRSDIGKMRESSPARLYRYQLQNLSLQYQEHMPQ